MPALPDREQDAIAPVILAEMEAQRSWDKSFSRSPDILAKLVVSARAEYYASQTEDLNPDRLLSAKKFPIFITNF